MGNDFKEKANTRTDIKKYHNNYDNIFGGSNKKILTYGIKNQIYYNPQANTFLIIKDINVKDDCVNCILIDIDRLCLSNMHTQYNNNSNLIEIEYLNKCVATTLKMENIK